MAVSMHAILVLEREQQPTTTTRRECRDNRIDCSFSPQSHLIHFGAHPLSAARDTFELTTSSAPAAISAATVTSASASPLPPLRSSLPVLRALCSSAPGLCVPEKQSDTQSQNLEAFHSDSWS